MKPPALAGLLGITTRRLGQLHSEGIAVKVDRGLYDAAATIQAMLAHASGKAAGNSVELDLDRERARLAKEQADGQAIKNAQARGELLVREDVERTWSDALRQLRSGMLAITSRVRQKITIEPADALVIDREIRDALTKLSDGDEIAEEDAEGSSPSAETTT
jgi:phage terminase Nu1 subunit (DNA packaging protein)